MAASDYSCVHTEVADMQAQQLIEEWIEEQVIKIDENKYDLTFTSMLAIQWPEKRFTICL